MSDDTFTCNSCSRRRKNEHRAAVIRNTRFICDECEPKRQKALAKIRKRQDAARKSA